MQGIRTNVPWIGRSMQLFSVIVVEWMDEVQFSGRRNWFWIIKQLLQFSWVEQEEEEERDGWRRP